MTDRPVLSYHHDLQAQQSVDLTPAVEDLQQLGSELGAEGQEAGQAAGNAVGLTPTRLASAGAQLQEGTHAALIGAAKDVVRTIGVDSDYPNFQTPGSQYGETIRPILLPVNNKISPWVSCKELSASFLENCSCFVPHRSSTVLRCYVLVSKCKACQGSALKD